MVCPITHRHVLDVAGVHALQASQVEAVLIKVRPAAMVRVNSTLTAEIMFSRAAIETIDGKHFLAFDNAEAFDWHRTHNRAFAPAHRAVAPPDIRYAIGQVQLKNNTATVTRCPMRRLNHGVAYLSKAR
jgi:hypothetical protein